MIFQFSSVQAERMSIWPPCVGRERKKGGQICLFQEKEKSESDRIPSENIEKKKVNRFFLSMRKRRDILSLSLYLSLSSNASPPLIAFPHLLEKRNISALYELFLIQCFICFLSRFFHFAFCRQIIPFLAHYWEADQASGDASPSKVPGPRGLRFLVFLSFFVREKFVSEAKKLYFRNRLKKL